MELLRSTEYAQCGLIPLLSVGECTGDVFLFIFLPTGFTWYPIPKSVKTLHAQMITVFLSVKYMYVTHTLKQMDSQLNKPTEGQTHTIALRISKDS